MRAVLVLVLLAACGAPECETYPAVGDCLEVAYCCDEGTCWWEWEGGTLVEPAPLNAVVEATCM